MSQKQESKDTTQQQDSYSSNGPGSSAKLFIGISGLIAAGKTTLATALGEEMGLPVFYEPVIDNVYLADFYKNPKKYSFNLQVQNRCNGNLLIA